MEMTGSMIAMVTVMFQVLKTEIITRMIARYGSMCMSATITFPHMIE